MTTDQLLFYPVLLVCGANICWWPMKFDRWCEWR